MREPDAGKSGPERCADPPERSPVITAAHLPAMDARLVKTYLDRRLTAAGGPQGIFTADAAELICRRTGGIPRLVDQLADLALIYAYTYDARQVDVALVQQVFDDGLFPGQRAPEDDEENPVFTLRPTRTQTE